MGRFTGMKKRCTREKKKKKQRRKNGCKIVPQQAKQENGCQVWRGTKERGVGKRAKEDIEEKDGLGRRRSNVKGGFVNTGCCRRKEKNPQKIGKKEGGGTIKRGVSIKGASS